MGYNMARDRKRKQVRVRGVYQKGCGRCTKRAEGCRSAPCLALVPFLKKEPKCEMVQGGSGRCRERIGVRH